MESRAQKLARAVIGLGLVGVVVGGLQGVPFEPVRAPRSQAPPTAYSASPSASPSIPSPSPKSSPNPAPVSRSSCGVPTANIVSFRVEIDPSIKLSRQSFARAVRRILCDERSWIASGSVRFRYHPLGSLLIGLRTPDESQRRCLQITGLSVNRTYSCGTRPEVVINSDRWFGNSSKFPASLTEYRRMLINHEVGHSLGLHHQSCTADGEAAPVMMQQSKGMHSSNGFTCIPNPWPRKEELARLRSIRK